MPEACPNCGAGEPLTPVYRQQGVPVHSVVLIRDRLAAETWPRGDIELVFCRECGYAVNRAFDPEAVRYGPHCEETQGASTVFNVFQQRLAAGLMERHGLRGGHIVEIGCGKGEFLSLLCAAAEARGTGFDPAYAPGRIELPDGVAVRQENFDSSCHLHDADFLMCRMTLEHISDPRAFVGAVRRALGRAGVPVFFQVPDAGRVYRTLAFWDIYYEHCSYFTAAALSRLFTESGFEVDGLSSEYAGQYLTLHARTADGPVPADADTGDARRDADRFRREVGGEVARWRALVDSSRGGVALWGGGSKAVAFLTRLDIGPEVERVIDINPRKHGTFLPGTGHPVVAPSALADGATDLVIVMNGIYEAEVRRELAAAGVGAGVLALP